MAFNNFNPNMYAGNGYYQANQYQPQVQPQVQNQNTNTSNGIIWVQGEAGAKSYIVAPNQTVQLWDSEAQKIYLKSADTSGMPNIKVLNYTIEDNAPAQAPIGQNTDFATKEDVISLENEIKGLKTKLESINQDGGKKDE